MSGVMETTMLLHELYALAEVAVPCDDLFLIFGVKRPIWPEDQVVYVPSLPRTKSQAKKLLRGPVVYLADGNERPFKLCAGFTYRELLLAHA
jgi:hypothetical protein